MLFQKLNSYHPNIKFTTEISPDKFLDTKIMYQNGHIETAVYRSANKLPVHWTSKIPKKYKRNAINADLHRAKNISSTFEEEKARIFEKFSNAGFPARFISSVVRSFENRNIDTTDDEMIIPEHFFEPPKKFIMVTIPFCERNENLSKKFIQKFHEFTQDKYSIVIKWNTKKVQSLFKLKSENPHQSCKIYHGVCSCGETYIGETKRNVEVRWDEHNDPSGKSEPSKHSGVNKDHKFTWSIMSHASINFRERKILEAYYIAINKPTLNNQTDTKVLHLFRNGVT